MRSQPSLLQHATYNTNQRGQDTVQTRPFQHKFEGDELHLRQTLRASRTGYVLRAQHHHVVSHFRLVSVT